VESSAPAGSGRRWDGPALRAGWSVVIAKAAALARVPGLLGTIAFVQLPRIFLLNRSPPQSACPRAEPIETVQLPAAVVGKPS
jgi:hypothetical protein